MAIFTGARAVEVDLGRRENSRRKKIAILGDHPKAAIDDRVKSGHTEKA
jgi:hypothetical protein